MINGYYSELFVINFNYICFISIQSQLVSNKLLTHMRENSDSMQKQSKFLLEIVTLISSAYITGTDKVYYCQMKVIYTHYETQR
jgi:ribosomal protein L6P/L9E